MVGPKQRIRKTIYLPMMFNLDEMYFLVNHFVLPKALGFITLGAHTFSFMLYVIIKLCLQSFLSLIYVSHRHLFIYPFYKLK